MALRPESGSVPDQPGSYHWSSADALFMLEKPEPAEQAEQLLSRRRNLHPRTLQMLESAATVEWIEVATEVDALVAVQLIQRHQPRFSVRLRADRSYPFLSITMRDEWPRATVMRGKKKEVISTGHSGTHDSRNFDLLLRTFPIRTCSDNKLAEHQRLGRPCLLFHIEQCAGPCVGK